MIRDFNQICEVMISKIDEYGEKYGSHENWKEHVKQDMHLKFIRKLNATYIRAQVSATKYGYIGVGAISFAEHRLQEYQRRLANKIA